MFDETPNDSFDTVQNKRKLKRLYFKYLEATKNAEESLASVSYIVDELLTGKGLLDNIIESHVNRGFAQFTIEEMLMASTELILKSLPVYDQFGPDDPGEEPSQPVIDLWAKDNPDMPRNTCVLSLQRFSRLSGSPLSQKSRLSVKSKNLSSRRPSKNKFVEIPPNPKFKQFPIDIQNTESDFDSEDSKLRKYVARQAHIAEILRK